MKKKSDMQHHVDEPFMRVLPQSANRIIVESREGNILEVTCGLAPSDNIYLVTKAGVHIKIDKEGYIADTTD